MLLIRSQDKNNLVNINLVKCISIDNGRTIIADYGQGFIITLGHYKTCDRAIKVLDLFEDVHNSLNLNCPSKVQTDIAGNFLNGISGYGFVINGTYDMPLLNTEQTKDLTGTLIADIVLQLLSYVAQKERENIRERQLEGIAIAKEQGKYKGGKEKQIDMVLFNENRMNYEAGAINKAQFAENIGVSRPTLDKLIKKYQG